MAQLIGLVGRQHKWISDVDEHGFFLILTESPDEHFFDGIQRRNSMVVVDFYDGFSFKVRATWTSDDISQKRLDFVIETLQSTLPFLKGQNYEVANQRDSDPAPGALPLRAGH